MLRCIAEPAAPVELHERITHRIHTTPRYERYAMQRRERPDGGAQTTLTEPTHSERFVRILEKHYPSWREARAELNELPLAAETSGR